VGHSKRHDARGHRAVIRLVERQCSYREMQQKKIDERGIAGVPPAAHWLSIFQRFRIVKINAALKQRA
ncbi:MAG: hypothetical protein KGJ00_17805, partial [Bradyrhizobium sp.]|nr:hypothetical protein [Bradyrhizobium sp.]